MSVHTHATRSMCVCIRVFKKKRTSFFSQSSKRRRGKSSSYIFFPRKKVVFLSFFSSSVGCRHRRVKKKRTKSETSSFFLMATARFIASITTARDSLVGDNFLRKKLMNMQNFKSLGLSVLRIYPIK